MRKKPIFLFLALLLPILIFIFLKLFGRNEFDIPVQYASGVPDSIRCEGVRNEVPYHVSADAFPANNKSTAYLFVTEVTPEFTRKMKEFQSASVRTIRIKETDPIAKCGLYLHRPWTAALVDEQRRIRGYYALTHRDDLDRLEVELKILLKQY